VQRFRGRPKTVEDRIRQTAMLDGDHVWIFIEEEPGSSGKGLIDHYRRNVLGNFIAYGHKASGSKVMRAHLASSAAEGGNVRLIQAPWNHAFLDEVELFPMGPHDDQVDALSGAFHTIPRVPQGEIQVAFGRRPSVLDRIKRPRY
jgi:predicted phage terminase large subunit-like protein